MSRSGRLPRACEIVLESVILAPMGQGPDTPLAPLLAPMKIKALWWIAASGAAGIPGCVAAGVRGDRVIRERHNGRMVLAAADGQAERSFRA